MLTEGHDSRDELRGMIAERHRALAAYVWKVRARINRLAVTSIVASGLGALVTAGPAARGNDFISGLQNSLRLSNNVQAGQLLCGAAFLVALVSGVTVHLLQRSEKIAHLPTAEGCKAELETLLTRVTFNRIPFDKALEKYNECVERAKDVPDSDGREPSTGQGGDPRWHRVIGVGAVVAILGAGVGVGFALGSRAPAPDQAQGVHLEGIAQIGPAPFTNPVGEDQGGGALPPWAGGAHRGDAAALYAVTSAQASCDPGSLVAQLEADPVKAAAWVRPMGIGVRDLDGFVNGLTPVVLRADTAVTDYGFPDGAAQPYASILQMGTAVLVNSYGEPTVKCVSGDPLGRPTSFNQSNAYVGNSWDGFRADKVCSIEPAPAQVGSFVVVDLQSGDHVTVAAKPDPKAVKGPNPDPAGTRFPTG